MSINASPCCNKDYAFCSVCRVRLQSSISHLQSCHCMVTSCMTIPFPLPPPPSVTTIHIDCHRLCPLSCHHPNDANGGPFHDYFSGFHELGPFHLESMDHSMSIYLESMDCSIWNNYIIDFIRTFRTTYTMKFVSYSTNFIFTYLT